MTASTTGTTRSPPISSPSTPTTMESCGSTLQATTRRVTGAAPTGIRPAACSRTSAAATSATRSRSPERRRVCLARLGRLAATDQDFDLISCRWERGRLLAWSQTVQRPGQLAPPVEEACYANTSPSPLPVYATIEALPPATTSRFDLFVTTGTLEHSVPQGSVAQPAESPYVLAVGAICWLGRERGESTPVQLAGADDRRTRQARPRRVRRRLHKDVRAVEQLQRRLPRNVGGDAAGRRRSRARPPAAAWSEPARPEPAVGRAPLASAPSELATTCSGRDGCASRAARRRRRPRHRLRRHHRPRRPPGPAAEARLVRFATSPAALAGGQALRGLDRGRAERHGQAQSAAARCPARPPCGGTRLALLRRRVPRRARPLLLADTAAARATSCCAGRWA